MIFAKVDRPAGVVVFTKAKSPVEVLSAWSCTSTNCSCVFVSPRSMVDPHLCCVRWLPFVAVFVTCPHWYAAVRGPSCTPSSPADISELLGLVEQTINLVRPASSCLLGWHVSMLCGCVRVSWCAGDVHVPAPPLPLPSVAPCVRLIHCSFPGPVSTLLRPSHA